MLNIVSKQIDHHLDQADAYAQEAATNAVLHSPVEDEEYLANLYLQTYLKAYAEFINKLTK